MNDTNKQILLLFSPNSRLSSSDVHAQLSSPPASITVKRALSELTEQQFLVRYGAGRATTYSLAKKGLLLRPFDVQAYISHDQLDRNAQKEYNFDIFRGELPPLFTSAELTKLQQATHEYTQLAEQNSDVIKKELARFIVEMSWKSAQIEGNTYTLLDTEQLLLHGIKSPRNTEFETQMILNQKAAFEYIYDNLAMFSALTLSDIEDIHKLVVRELGVTHNLRKTIIGITGTEYKPPTNPFQIKEALQDLLAFVGKASNPHEQALLYIVGISYIQPFNDGNKRTARMVANGSLLGHDLAPVSYRGVDSNDYRAAILIFYEQNSIAPFKQLFIEQYCYSATHYNIAQPPK